MRLPRRRFPEGCLTQQCAWGTISPYGEFYAQITSAPLMPRVNAAVFTIIDLSTLIGFSVLVGRQRGAYAAGLIRGFTKIPAYSRESQRTTCAGASPAGHYAPAPQSQRQTSHAASVSR